MDLPHNKLVSVLAAILLSVCMCACSDKENQVIPYYRVSISYDQLYLAPGDSIGIHYHVAQYGRTIEIVTDYQNPPVWRSSNPTIATVDTNGIVRAVSPGICTGLNFRLPTLEEWQFAAGGGLMGHGFIYSGSDNIDEVGWYVENFPYNKGYYTRGSKMANELGLFDCSGGLPELVTMPEESESPYAVCGGFYRAAARYCGVNSYEPAYLNGHDRVRYGGTSCGYYGLRLVLDSI